MYQYQVSVEKLTNRITVPKGLQTRSRACQGPYACGRPCEGENSTVESCNDYACPVSSVWGEWETWSACSATCGDGTRSRQRTCSPTQGTCTGEATQTDTCHITDCCVPKNGLWSDWNSWSPCSQTCGRGFRSRSRTCSEPNACGRPCEGNDSQDEICNLQTCAGNTQSTVSVLTSLRDVARLSNRFMPGIGKTILASQSL